MTPRPAVRCTDPCVCATLFGLNAKRWHEGYGAGRSERREVKWAAEYMFYDPNQIPPEWRLWLRKLREQPPTDEELAQ